MRHLVVVIFVSLGLVCLTTGAHVYARAPSFATAPAGPSRIVVDAGGKGDFRTIQDALNSLSDQSATPRLIFVRKGVYNEKIFRSFQTTRLKVLHCTLRAFGGDTVSPWNVAAGLFYFKDCRMEGGVDFYCPRGWAYAEGCTFVALNGPACIWHDGSVDRDSKTVLKDCSFSGYDGFKLGRYHREAQFYLVHCSFAENMADQDIYLVPTATPIHWGRRVYYYDCHKKGNEYKWYANNLDQAPGAPAPEKIGPAWVFSEKWNPLK